MIKSIVITSVLVLSATTSFAANFNNAQNAQNLAVGTQSFRTANGTTCSTSIMPKGGIQTYGISGSVATQDKLSLDKQAGNNFFNDDSTSVTVFYTISKPLGGNTNTLDCNRLYNLELEKMKAELEALKAAAAAYEQGGDDAFDEEPVEEDPFAGEAEDPFADEEEDLFGEEEEAPSEESSAPAAIKLPSELTEGTE